MQESHVNIIQPHYIPLQLLPVCILLGSLNQVVHHLDLIAGINMVCVLKYYVLMEVPFLMMLCLCDPFPIHLEIFKTSQAWLSFPHSNPPPAHLHSSALKFPSYHPFGTAPQCDPTPHKQTARQHCGPYVIAVPILNVSLAASLVAACVMCCMCGVGRRRRDQNTAVPWLHASVQEAPAVEPKDIKIDLKFWGGPIIQQIQLECKLWFITRVLICIWLQLIWQLSWFRNWVFWWNSKTMSSCRRW